MDFSSRNPQPTAPAPAAPAPARATHKQPNTPDASKWVRAAIVLAVLAIVGLLIGVIITISSSDSSTNKEASYVNTGKLQAVFLNTGQVYFGNITTLNNKFFVVNNIYYLQTATTDKDKAASSSVSLVKLGCELHEPYDKMVINRDQVTFWENLQDGGQVAKAVTAFEKANPSGQKCSDQSSSSSNTSNSVQNAGSSAKP